MKFKQIIISFLTIVFVVGILNVTFSQSNYSELRNELHKDGFIYVRILEHDEELIVGFENKRYRSDIEAVVQVLKYVNKHSGSAKGLVLVAHEMQMPVTQIKVSSDMLNAFFDGAIEKGVFSQNIDIAYANSRYCRLLDMVDATNKFRFGADLIMEPKIRFQLGSYDHPLRFNYWVLPALESSFWKGQKISLQASVPLYSYYYDTIKHVSPHIIKLEQNYRLAKGLFSKVNVGWFTDKRYGVDAELAYYLLDGRLMLRANAGYTGYMLYVKKGNYGLNGVKYEKSSLEFDGLDYKQYFFNIEYRIPKFDLIFGAGYGKYLYENHAYSIDIYRNFKESLFGVHAIYSETGYNFGFNIRIPLIPSQYYQNKKFSLRPSKFLKYSYLATQDYADVYRTGNIINEVIRELNPKMLENYMYRTLFLH